MRFEIVETLENSRYIIGDTKIFYEEFDADDVKSAIIHVKKKIQKQYKPNKDIGNKFRHFISATFQLRIIELVWSGKVEQKTVPGKKEIRVTKNILTEETPTK